jgi:tetratricopeptide (TPR) repeat protein
MTLTPSPGGQSLLIRTTILKRAASLSLFLAILLTACGSRYGKLAFGVDMTRRGLWSEALFRFHQAAQLEPQNPRVLNNLGVAYEATGDYEKALSFYQQALKIEPNNRELRANYGRFVEFYQAYKGKEGKDKGTGAQPATTAAPPAAQPAAEETPPPPQEEEAEEARPPA